MRTVQVFGGLLVPVACTEDVFGRYELHAAELAQELGCFFLYGGLFQFRIFYRFTVQVNLIVVEPFYPIRVLAVKCHQVHIE